MAYPTDLAPESRTYSLVPAPKSDDPDVIRQQIDHTRSQMGTTINAIGERLSPENLIEQAKSSAREATVGRIKDMTNEANRKMEGVSSSLSQTVRDNPLPVALIGLGLGWLWMSGRNKPNGYSDSRFIYRSSQYDDWAEEDQGRLDHARDWVGEAAHTAEQMATGVKSRAGEVAQNLGETVGDVTQRAGETAQRAGEAVGEAAQRAGEAVGGAAGTVQERVSETAARTRQEAERLRLKAQWRSQLAMNSTKRTFWESMEENPLVVGAVVAIAGAAVGASIPATNYEDQLLGETRDRLLGEAKVRAQDAVERVQSVVEDTQRAVVTEARESAQRHHLTVEDVVSGDENHNGF